MDSIKRAIIKKLHHSLGDCGTEYSIMHAQMYVFHKYGGRSKEMKRFNVIIRKGFIDFLQWKGVLKPFVQETVKYQKTKTFYQYLQCENFTNYILRAFSWNNNQSKPCYGYWENLHLEWNKILSHK